MPSTFRLKSQSGVVRFSWICLALVVMLSAAVGARPSVAQDSQRALFITQIYTRGGEPDSPYPYDFVEFYNPGPLDYYAFDVSVQYASGTGTDTFGQNGIQTINVHYVPERANLVAWVPSDFLYLPEPGEVPPHDPIPYHNYSPMRPGGLYDSGGIIAIVSGYEPLDCNGSTDPCSAAERARIIDLVGYGDTELYEGTAAAPAPGSTEVIYRTGNFNTVDTNDNGSDFAIGVPNPRAGWTVALIKSNAAASPPTTFKAESTLLTVAVQPAVNPTSTGITVYGDLRPIGGAATQPFYDDGTHGDITAGDTVFSYRATVRGIELGWRLLYIWMFDAEGRTNNSFGISSIEEVEESESYQTPKDFIDLGIGQPLGSGTAIPHVVPQGGSTLLAIDVTRTSQGTFDDIDARCDLEPLTGIADSAFIPLFDDGTHGDVTAGDHRFSLLATVDQGIGEGFIDIRCVVRQIVTFNGRTVTTSFRPHIALTVGENIDPQPPTGTVTIVQATTSGIDVQVAAEDDVSNADQLWMRLSTQPEFIDAIWQPYKTGAVVPRAQNSMVHIYVQFEDAAGNRSRIQCAATKGGPCAVAGPAKLFLPLIRP